MRFVWFWTFWHWSKESFRGGSLLRNPLHGVGSHWDEWFRHEALESDLRAIAEAGRTESAQRQFIAWLYLHWAHEANWSGNRLIPRFVLGQLAPLSPFKEWQAFDEYRVSYGIGGIPAIVLTAESSGEAEDIRPVEALTLPADTGPKTVSEGFRANAAELETPHRAAMNVLSGKGLLIFLALWLVGGQRPYPRWLKTLLGLGWLSASGLILYLLVGPEPGERLFSFAATLTGLWSALGIVAVTVAVKQCFYAWRQGQRWSSRLEQSQVRLRMNGGLTIKGGSAGLPFCLNMLISLFRADPRATDRSWIWQRLGRRLRAETNGWAATGVVTGDGFLKPVVLEPKLRACLQHAGIKHILTPSQRDASRWAVARLIHAMTPAILKSEPDMPTTAHAQLGFAAEERRLVSHRCRHVAQALMALGGFTSGWQKAMSALAVAVSCLMLLALQDLLCILLPPRAPDVVAPASPSPYYLWVSLDTKHPEYFEVVLESKYWSNRRAKVMRYSGADASVRAEIFLHRLTGQIARDGEDGTVWIERRRRFLTREYASDERVGRYSIAYLNRLVHD